MNCRCLLIGGHYKPHFLCETACLCLGVDVASGHSPIGARPYCATYQTSCIFSASSFLVTPKNSPGIRTHIFPEVFFSDIPLGISLRVTPGICLKFQSGFLSELHRSNRARNGMGKIGLIKEQTN